MVWGGDQLQKQVARNLKKYPDQLSIFIPKDIVHGSYYIIHFYKA